MRKGSLGILTWLWAGLMVAWSWGPVWPVYAQGAITVVSDEHEHVFKESLTFRLEVQSSSRIAAIRLFYRVTGQTSTNKAEITFDPAASVQAEHVEDMREESNYEPPMIEITYWWVIENENGDRLKTDPVSFVYEDTRFTWQVLEGDLVRVYWHDQDLSFGQTFFDRAVAAADDLSTEFDVLPKDPIAIVIYNSHQELMSTLVESSAEWTGAVNYGDKASIAIGLGPMSWMEKVIPHELTHAMLDQVTQPPFGEIPRWLHEGLAMRSEGGMSIEERTALADAIRDDALISLRVLNSAFADAREQAILSYAESYSLISFVLEEYGPEKLGELIAVFAQGAHYDDAMLGVFGVDMDGMEDLWREHIGAPARVGVTRATPVPTATEEPLPTPTGAVVIDPTPTATPVPAVPTPTRASEQTAEVTPAAEATPTAVPRSAGPCLGAAPMMAVLMLFVLVRPRLPR